jgi:predicted PurR-regulated permease PerM
MSVAQFAQRVLVFAGIALALLVLVLAYEVLLLAFGALLLATLLRAIADFIVRHAGLSPAAGFACAIVLVLAVIAAAAYIFGAQVSAQVNALADTLPGAIASLRRHLEAQAWLRPLVEHFGGSGNAAGIVSRLGNFALAGFDIVAGVVVIIFGAVYFGAQPALYRHGLVLLFPREHQPRVREALDAAGYAMRRWLLGQLIDMALIGVLSGIGLWALGVPSAFALAILSGLASFVPYVGPVVAGALAVLVAAAQSLELGLWTLLLYVAVQQIEGHLIMPFVHRWAIALPPALAVFAVLAAGYVLGPLGVLFATPLAVVLFVLVKKLYLQDTLGENVSIKP